MPAQGMVRRQVFIENGKCLGLQLGGLSHSLQRPEQIDGSRAARGKDFKGLFGIPS